MAEPISTDAIPRLAGPSREARSRYAALVAGMENAGEWWDVVAITASSERQAERYQWEIERRRERGRIPANVRYLVLPDPGDRRVGSGGATLLALKAIAKGGVEWWERHRVLLIHCGGDSRRLPQYSLSGKIFTALPVRTPWGEASTVFDETLMLSTAWVRRLEAGLVVGSGDVVLTFDAAELDWSRPGVCGVAMSQPVEQGTQHGVYVADENGRVYSFLQKPSVAEVRTAGGLKDNQVALDVGLLYFDPYVAARLSAIEFPADAPPVDLYEHMTLALTGAWRPRPADARYLHELSEALELVPFWCSLVHGDFTHVGTTALFRRLLTEDTQFSALYETRMRLGSGEQPGVRSAGVLIDSLLGPNSELGAGALAIECNLAGAVHAARGAVLHGVEGLDGAIEVPEDTVLHQVPVTLPSGAAGVVMRVYGVSDDPKALVSTGQATWLGRELMEQLARFGLAPELAWPGLDRSAWSLWNARLFPAGTVGVAWACARWLLGQSTDYSAREWAAAPRLSLESSARLADVAAIGAAQGRRLKAGWCASVVALADGGADIRPMLAHSPGIEPLASAAALLVGRSRELAADSPSEGASRQFQAAMLYRQAGLENESESAREAAFGLVETAVSRGSYAVTETQPNASAAWALDEVVVDAPARLDFGGGWSDTPPFCLDWGGTVLNVAVELNGACPIRVSMSRLSEPVIRCQAGADASVEWNDSVDILGHAPPGDPFSVPRIGLRLTGLFSCEEKLTATLERLGGGLSIRTEVDLPMGSGLGTSSILGAAVVRALAAMLGRVPGEQELTERVMRLEQMMTTGGGWQDQAGGIFPGAKLVLSGPGLTQRLRVEPLRWDGARRKELEQRMVLFGTGIRRIAKGLLQEVVGGYLARETQTLQVLHSIKTLALEMSYALQQGEWEHFGELLDRHWELNKILDPHTTNTPINTLLSFVRPWILGAKLAGAGGGGFVMLLCRSEQMAAELRGALAERFGTAGGAVYEWRVAQEGLRVHAPAPVRRQTF